MKHKNTSKQSTDKISSLSAEQAYTTGAAVGSTLNSGAPIENAVDMTVRVAEFLKKGTNAQQAVDKIIAQYS